MDFEQDLVNDNDWPEEKRRLIESGENPAKCVPILYFSGRAHPQTIAGARYLARVKGLTSGDDYQDYVQDLVADEYQGFCEQWVQAMIYGDEDAKKAYKENVVPGQLKKFDALYDTFLSVSSTTARPLWGDAAMFGLLRDHIFTGCVTREELVVYPRLTAMLTDYEEIPEVKKFLDSLEMKESSHREEQDIHVGRQRKRQKI